MTDGLAFGTGGGPKLPAGGRTPYVLALGQRLRSVRKRAGLSLAALEEASGGRWSIEVTGSWERGDRRISPENLIAIAAFYDVPATWLLTGATAPAAEGAADFAAAWMTSPPLVAEAFVAITRSAAPAEKERIRLMLLAEAEKPCWDADM